MTMMEGFEPLPPTVVCVLRTGKFKGREYNGSDVCRLKAMVTRNLAVPHRFVCFTDTKIDGIECLVLRYDLPGWWSKIELFAWNAGCRLLYLDLDVLVTGSLEPLLNYPAPMALAPAIVTKPKAKMVRRYQSSVMVWTPPAGREVFYSFSPAVMDEFHGDQDWIGHIAPDCVTFPASWVCKWREQHADGPPKDAKVMLVQHPQTVGALAKKYKWVREASGESTGQLGVSKKRAENPAGRHP